MSASFVKQVTSLYFSCFNYLGFHILAYPKGAYLQGFWLMLCRCLHLCCVCGVGGQLVSIPACVSEATPRLMLSSCAR